MTRAGFLVTKRATPPSAGVEFNPVIPKITASFAGLLSFVFISVGGQLSLAEVISPIIIVLSFATVIELPHIIAIWVSTAVVLASYFALAPVYDKPDSLVLQYSANVFAVALLTTSLACVAVRIGFETFARWFAIGLALSITLTTVIAPDVSAQADPWKFGYGIALALGSLALSDLLSSTTVFGATLLVALACIAQFAMGTRSLAAVLLIAAAFSWAGSGGAGKQFRRMSVVVMVVFSLLLLLLFVAPSILGAKSEEQDGSYGLLFGARKELLVLLTAIVKGPWFGWGPAPSPPWEVRSVALRWYVEHGYRLEPFEIQYLFRTPVLPLHSGLLMLITTAGLLALPLVAVLAQIWGRGWVRATSSARVGSITWFFLIYGVYTFLFSPIGDATRVFIATSLAIALCFAYRRASP